MYPCTPSTSVVFATILAAIQREATGLKGFEPLTYRCPSDVPMERADKSRSLYLAKLQARGGAYWPTSVKRCAGGKRPIPEIPQFDGRRSEKFVAGSNPSVTETPGNNPRDPTGRWGLRQRTGTLRSLRPEGLGLGSRIRRFSPSPRR